MRSREDAAWAAKCEEMASRLSDARATVSTVQSTPSKRDAKARDAASTAGQVAAKAGVSLNKAKQAKKCEQMAGQIQREQLASEPAPQKAWQEKCQYERDRLLQAEYKQMCDQVLAEQTASLAEKAKDPAWQAQMDEIARQIKREHRAENLARRMLQERRLESFATDGWLGCLCGWLQKSEQSESGSQEQHHCMALAMGSLLKLCDHLGITDPGADDSQQLAREQQWQSSRSFDREATLCALEDEGSHIGTLMLMLFHRQTDWEPGDPAEDMVDALFALIDALPKSTPQQAGGAE